MDGRADSGWTGRTGLRVVKTYGIVLGIGIVTTMGNRSFSSGLVSRNLILSYPRKQANAVRIGGGVVI